MADPQHPTNPDWEMFDPEVTPPPSGDPDLIVLTAGMVMRIGKWDPTCRAWAYKPGVPQSVKDRWFRTKP